MTGKENKTAWSTRNIILVAAILSVIVGGVTGYATATLLRPLPAAQDRTFYLFTTILGFNDTKAEMAFGTPIPHDYFAPDRITVDKGDRVTIRYYNTEDEPEDHTFTMGYSKYSFDATLHFQQVMNFNFTADTPGVFTYRCTLHQPTMTGYLVVLG